MITFLLDTGARRGEVAGLRVTDIDFDLDVALVLAPSWRCRPWPPACTPAPCCAPAHAYGRGTNPHPSLVVLAYTAAELLALLPFTPGGLGFVEAGLVGVRRACRDAAVLAGRLLAPDFRRRRGVPLVPPALPLKATSALTERGVAS